MRIIKMMQVRRKYFIQSINDTKDEINEMFRNTVTGTLKKSMIQAIDCKTGETIVQQLRRDIEQAEFEAIE